METKAVRALVLAGGGAKGSYQVGVWRALMELGWKPDIITGTSVGCLNGAMFVLDQYETARDMWMSIGDKNVMKLPEDNSLAALHTFVKDFITEGGLDVAPLEEIVTRVLDEKALRTAPIRFGLVTVERRGLRARELALEEIPEGRVADYLMASAACFPAIRAKEIDGVKYLDGGYSDNMPFGLAKRMGATELLCVNVDGVGLTRPNFSGLPTQTIESHWDLGELFRFVPEVAKRNMALGYYDTLRAFGRLRGTAYAVLADETAEKQTVLFRVLYDACLLQAVKANPALAVTELAALALFRAADKPLAPLEAAAEKAGVPPTELYTVETLCRAFLKAFSETVNGARFAKLTAGETDPVQAALAAVQPTEFLTALVAAALCGTEEQP